MIHQVGADRDTFKTLTFGPGLNVILADKSQGATDRQSRNGAGKTSFVELVHFLCGANAKSNGIFRSEALRNWTFNALIDVGGSCLSISRSGTTSGRIHVGGDDTIGSVNSHLQQSLAFEEPNLPAVPREISNTHWKDTLGARWFGLSTDEGSDTGKFRPTFRSLFSFAARRQENGGFQNPMHHTSMQQVWDRQVSVSYLIGLDWTVPSRFQECREREKSAKQLRQAARSEELGPFLGNAAEL
ncbi:MAG: hypothetical protein OXC13_06950 [Caldilineaceae bacterium]|nr:hypothetical protein [Caldilineaceae bacterium]